LGLFWKTKPKLSKEKADTTPPASPPIAAEKSAPIPNWPIDELFSYIEPRILEDNGAHLDATGHKIKDALALGRLKAWGRPIDHSGLGAMLGERNPPQKIKPTYWHFAHFTYHFFDDTSGNAPHTYVDQGHSEVEYTDLQVNRAEATSIWMRGEPAPTPALDWKSVPEAIEAFADPALLAARRKWDESLGNSIDRQFDLESKKQELIKKLPAGRIIEGSDEAVTIGKHDSQIGRWATLQNHQEPELRRAWDDLRSDMQKKLMSGSLRARGFRAPYSGGDPEVDISPAEWRILRLDNVKSAADDGSKVIYSGLVICQKA
jgi:hypothetical protein